jgi:hypothetical protein
MANNHATLIIRRNMFLRWMVRNDDRGVDFGLWKRIDPSMLYIPLDIDNGRSEGSIFRWPSNGWLLFFLLTYVTKLVLAT